MPFHNEVIDANISWRNTRRPHAEGAEEENFVGACGAAYPVIPLAKAQRTQRTHRKKKGFLYVSCACS